ncbi:MAG: toll/interleukin-1 receptor domain-containing protein [Pseudomonadota bacterium]
MSLSIFVIVLLGLGLGFAVACLIGARRISNFPLKILLAIFASAILSVAAWWACGWTTYEFTSNNEGALIVAFIGGFVAFGGTMWIGLTGSRNTESKPQAHPETRQASATAPAKASAKPFTPPDVFISYKRDERPEVEEIARRLKDLDVSVWFDAELNSGLSFDAEIDRNIREAKCVLVCWSPGAVSSEWVRGEATIGRQRGVLAASMLKPSDLPAPFNLIHAEDLTVGSSVENPGWLNLLGRIGDLIGRPGLARFAAFSVSGDKSAIAAWLAEHPNDPLFDRAVNMLKTG